MKSEIVDAAVYVRNAYKHYGPKSGPGHKQVLNGLNMTVERGSIYGLLGASGCGKTTLLSCIVGRRYFNSGELWVLGGTPGTYGSGVPGPRIGYMPQEIALVAEFSLRGVVSYFGKIVGMPEDKIQSRWEELRDLLDLPPDNRRVNQCSGGQQRRVSLLAALVHDPELLILDEPTVGLDPVLREKIWEYLVEITTTKNIAVIITTHYIEECRQAHKIGLMRQGQLMAEESPADLVVRFNAETLEEVFLNLSLKQAHGKLSNDPDDEASREEIIQPSGSSSVMDSITSVNTIQDHNSTDVLTKKEKSQKSKMRSSLTINPNRLAALFFKNWSQFFKNYTGVAFMILFPLIHLTIFYIAVGGDPKEIPIAYINDENGTCENFKFENSIIFVNKTDCDYRQLSCRYIQETDDPMIKKVFYNNVTQAYNDVKIGKVTGVLYIAKNFSESVRERIDSGRFADNYTLDFSEIKVWLDMSNKQIGETIQSKLYKKYIDFSKRMIKDCKQNPKIGELPVKFNDPVYGKADYTFSYFMAPGIILTVIFFLATMMTATIFINDRLEGVWDRTLVAGATVTEIMLAHVIIQFLMIIIQTLEAMIVTFAVFKLEFNGPLIDMFGIILFQGVSGMCFGFTISAFCNSHMMANFVSTGSFYPMLLISGIIWPIEGMPTVLWAIAKITPFTTPIEALRDVMAKGWTSTNLKIAESYGITSCWILLYVLITFYALKSKI